MSVASEPRGRFSGTEDGQRGPHRAHSGGDLQADTGLWWKRDRQSGPTWESLSGSSMTSQNCSLSLFHQELHRLAFHQKRRQRRFNSQTSSSLRTAGWAVVTLVNGAYTR